MQRFLELPTTPTIDEQRNVELTLLHFLRRHNPNVYALWHSHPRFVPHANGEKQASASARERAAAEGSGHTSLLRSLHVGYLSRQLGSLPSSTQGLYSSRPWLAYWSLQAADLLGVTETLFELTPAQGLVDLLMSCLVLCDGPHYVSQGGEGQRTRPVIGFAGGPAHQVPHVISAYAAVSALSLLHSFHPCLHRLPRAALKRWLLSLRTADGGFSACLGGETDIRASYAAAVITTLLRLDDPATFPTGVLSEVDEWAVDSANDCRAVYGRLGVCEDNGFDLSGFDDVRSTPILTEQTARYVAQKQTYEGGFTCDVFSSEAHGAYTQTGMASLLLMKQPQMVNLPRLRRWLAGRQLAFEGGFNGRVNKLVDSCYSHWVGSSHVLLEAAQSYARLLARDPHSRARRCERERERREDGAHRPAAADIEDEAEGGEFLRAKEMFLLDHVQVLDLSMASCTEEDSWDRAEAAESERLDLVERFMAADDAPRRECVSRRTEESKLWGKLHEQEHLGDGGLPRAEEDAARALNQLQADVDFTNAAVGDYIFNQRKLQQYILRCCQCRTAGEGGLRDKPECDADTYHTCYSLSGMSSAQNLQYLAHASNPHGSSYIRRAMERHYVPGKKEGYGVVVGVEGPSAGAEASVLRSTNPMINLHRSRVVSAMSTWGAKTIL